MRSIYDPRTDPPSIVFRSNVRLAESDEDGPGVILDYDKAGNLISPEILDPSERVGGTRHTEFRRA